MVAFSEKKLEPICELYRVLSNKTVTDGGGGFKKKKKKHFVCSFNFMGDFWTCMSFKLMP